MLRVTNRWGNANQNHTRTIASYPTAWLLLKQQQQQTKQKQSVGKDVKKVEPCALPVRMSNGAAAVENSVVIPQNTKHRITVSSSNSPLGVYSKGMKAET